MFLNKSDLDISGLSVLADITQGLLGNAEEGEVGFAGQLLVGCFGLYRDVERLLFVETGDVLAQGGDEAEVVEHRRMKLVGKPTHQSPHRVDIGGELLEALSSFRDSLHNQRLTTTKGLQDIEEFCPKSFVPLLGHAFAFLLLGID